MSQELVAVSISDMEKMAIAVSASNLFGIDSKEKAMSLMLIAQAEGTHPALAARDYHIIKGKPALKADAMLARFQAAGGKVEWHDLTDTKVSATFSHPSGGSAKIDWDMTRAKAAELGGNGMWKKYPRQMLRSRVVSEGIRTVFPGVVIGVYTPEEVQDFEEPRQNGARPMQDITPPAASSDDERDIPDHTKTSAAEYRPTDTLRPYKDDYVVPAPILPDGTLNFDMFAADLETLVDAATTVNQVSLYNRSNAKTLRQMQTERPDLFGAIGETFRKKSQQLM